MQAPASATFQLHCNLHATIRLAEFVVVVVRVVAVWHCFSPTKEKAGKADELVVRTL